MMTPSPRHAGHAPSEFALKSAGLTPFAFAKAVRIVSSMPVYVAGLLRRLPLMGAWSTTTTSSNARHVAVDEGRLARSGDTRDDRQDAERDVDIHVLQVVLGRAADLEAHPWPRVSRA